MYRSDGPSADARTVLPQNADRLVIAAVAITEPVSRPAWRWLAVLAAIAALLVVGVGAYLAAGVLLPTP